MNIRITLVFLVLFLKGGISVADLNSDSQDAYFKKCLMLKEQVIPALKKAVSIQVIEHTSPYDDPSNYNSYKEKIFSTIKLSPQQVKTFYSSLPSASDKSCKVVLACVFSSHHRIEAVQADGSVVKIEICFECGEMAIGKNFPQLIPSEWLPEFSSFISSLGMHPNGPWNNKK